jgi:nicotinamidase-related amidase
MREASVTRAVLVGAQTEYCVDTTARRAASMGYDVELVGDGHTTSSNGLLSRQQIIAHHNQTFANLAVDGVSLRVIPSDEVSFD